MGWGLGVGYCILGVGGYERAESVSDETGTPEQVTNYDHVDIRDTQRIEGSISQPRIFYTYGSFY